MLIQHTVIPTFREYIDTFCRFILSMFFNLKKGLEKGLNLPAETLKYESTVAFWMHLKKNVGVYTKKL